MENDAPSLISFADLSQITGMSESTLSTLLHRSRRNRSEGRVIPNDLPEPDTYYGSSPTWSDATVLNWLRARASGDGARRVKRVVDPEKSLEQRRAVPLPHTDSTEASS